MTAGLIHVYLAKYGYFVLFAVICAESLGLPLPGETILFAASFLASTGQLHFAGVAVIAIAAAVLGDNIGYVIGRWGGRRLVDRYGSRIGITPGHLLHTERFFLRFGPKIVIGARFIPVLRQLNGIVAGGARMPWKRFVVYNFLGAFFWVGTWTTAIYLLGDQIRAWLARIQGLSFWLAVSVGVIVLVGAGALYLRVIRK